MAAKIRGGMLQCASGSQNLRRPVPPCLNHGIAAYDCTEISHIVFVIFPSVAREREREERCIDIAWHA